MRALSVSLEFIAYLNKLMMSSAVNSLSLHKLFQRFSYTGPRHCFQIYIVPGMIFFYLIFDCM